MSPTRTLALFLGLALAACGGGGATPPAGSVTVEMKEWQVVIAKTTLLAGGATFFVKNTGSSAHDLVIVKTDKAPDQLANDGSKVTEAILAETQAINPGQMATLTVNLTAGKYVFICNQPGHYPLGMRTQVIVQ